MGRRSYPPTRRRPGIVEVAGGSQFVDGDRLPARRVFAGYMDDRDPPIVDKTIGRLYLCFNPTIDRSFHGPSVPQGVTFSPNVKVGYDVTKVVNAGFEYYGALGPITGFDPLQQQQQQIFAVTDLNFSPKWEFNFGVGVGLTGGTDHLLVKMILGRRVTTKQSVHRVKG